MPDRTAVLASDRREFDYLPSASGQWSPKDSHWDGTTYYGRPQVKAAPFNNWVVGGYIFLAGLSGASALIAALAEQSLGGQARDAVRRGRYLSLLAPTIGSGLLIYDLHTPHRFYNMLRIAKSTSPMSIGTWNLVSFSALAFSAALAQVLSDVFPRAGWLRASAAAVQLPTAVAGAGLSTYTAALLAATSTPTWAAAPRALAIRFGASSIASSAAALSLTEQSPRVRRKLDLFAFAGLAVELAATVAERRTHHRKGVAAAAESRWATMEKVGATGLGTLLPLGLYAASLAMSQQRGRTASTFAALAVLTGSALLRVSTMAIGDESASRPDVSLRFSQPNNLPEAEPSNRIGVQVDRLGASRRG